MPAILSNSVAILLAHNHPLGIPIPSKDDINITKKLMDSGKILGIDLLDHIIVGDDTFVSMKADSYI